MRAIILAIVGLPLALMHPACGQNAADPDRLIREMLPLFDSNRCAIFSDTAERLFCGDPGLNRLSARLSGAVQGRLDRIPNRRLAIEENAEWIRSRNSSCGIFRNQRLSAPEINYIKGCLLKQTEDRIDILDDPNFDCLSSNNAAGLLICSDPDLAAAKTDFNSMVVGLLAKLKGDDARRALLEYERWSRERDRTCDLADKDNVPLEELSSSEACLADYFKRKTAELAAAKGDPGRIFARPAFSPLPDANAVDLCVAQIHAANTCEGFLSVKRVIELDSEIAPASAIVTAEIEMSVLTPFAVCSPIASGCTGSCWDAKSGEAKPAPASRASLTSGRRVSIQKSFAFQRTDGGGWRCETAALQPVEAGVAMSAP
ncbi:hypothetical protein KMZ68_24150 [Bradyrhizobium sediminis]|uniref:Lysozyme inhibitor LprI N-terminal domain-containing protein n=1 Tax=Bradyrhizobium sediminis TaxID=2840469 RepID=A0A975NMV1_9BRAD|nr:hypothetical protein [Bradyrhizobium sediminis]QWG18007.1 hypothetical protein KMZ68_24150 [Bradyrhizobium sediminis]